MPLTITEALAEIKTIGKRMEKKRQSVQAFVGRQEGVRDPLEKEGGSQQFILQERQAIADLGKRLVTLRRGIQHANDTTPVTIGARTQTISEWLTWRREVAPGEQAFVNQLRTTIDGYRQQAKRNGALVVQAGAPVERPTDIVINLSEQDLAREAESLEEILGTLDGQLSLKNATVIIQE